jgi:8-oxo-dGTP pyrophosphatase MutT (NUDIX family)
MPAIRSNAEPPGNVPRKLPDDPAPWTVVSSEYLFRKPPWLVMRKERLRLPSGREIAEYWISEYPPWVNVVAVTPADQVVMVRQYRPALAEVHFEIPAGVVDGHDPDLLAAARRELAEETGYGGGRWSELMTLSANPALTTNLTHTFLAEGVEPLGVAKPDLTEDLRVHLVPLGELAGLIDAGEMIQALHVAPLLRYLFKRRG